MLCEALTTNVGCWQPLVPTRTALTRVSCAACMFLDALLLLVVPTALLRLQLAKPVMGNSHLRRFRVSQLLRLSPPYGRSHLVHAVSSFVARFENSRSLSSVCTCGHTACMWCRCCRGCSGHASWIAGARASCSVWLQAATKPRKTSSRRRAGAARCRRSRKSTTPVRRSCTKPTWTGWHHQPKSRTHRSVR